MGWKALPIAASAGADAPLRVLLPPLDELEEDPIGGVFHPDPALPGHLGDGQHHLRQQQGGGGYLLRADRRPALRAIECCYNIRVVLEKAGRWVPFDVYLVASADDAIEQVRDNPIVPTLDLHRQRVQLFGGDNRREHLGRNPVVCSDVIALVPFHVRPLHGPWLSYNAASIPVLNRARQGRHPRSTDPSVEL
eukprot:764339-Hanusia_phi.AAC.1